MEEPRISPHLFKESLRWPKYTRYELIEVDNDLYIKPAKGAILEYYDPNDKSPEILLDLINATYRFNNNDDSPSQAKEVLKFVNKYGMLGLAGYYASDFFVKNRRLKEEVIKVNMEKRDSLTNRVYELIENNHSKSKLRELKQEFRTLIDQLKELESEIEIYYVRLKTKNPFLNRLVSKYAPNSEIDIDEWKYEEYMSIFFPFINEPYPFEGEPDFWPNYCEPIYAYEHLLSKCTSDFFQWIYALEEFEMGNICLDDYYDGIDFGPTWRDVFDQILMIKGISLRLKINDDGTKTIEYVTETLYDKICLMFFQDRVSKKQLIKQCENEKCRNWFIAKSPKAQYCTTSCASSVRVARFRERKKGEKDTILEE